MPPWWTTSEDSTKCACCGENVREWDLEKCWFCDSDCCPQCFQHNVKCDNCDKSSCLREICKRCVRYSCKCHRRECSMFARCHHCEKGQYQQCSQCDTKGMLHCDYCNTANCVGCLIFVEPTQEERERSWVGVGGGGSLACKGCVQASLKRVQK